MHGTIKLESAIDKGTKATFSVQFQKPQYPAGSSQLVELGSLPERLRSEMSVSACASEGSRTSSTPPGHEVRVESPINTQPMPTAAPNYQASAFHERSRAGAAEPDRKNIHVMVVEDNAINQQIALKTVSKYGFSCFAVWNGQEALDYLSVGASEDHPMPQIILMDCQMPILDGLSCTNAIRNEQPFKSIRSIRGLPIIAMTASAIRGDREKCKRAGMDDYLAKPVNGKTLEQMLIKWLFEKPRKRNTPTSSTEDIHKQSSAPLSTTQDSEKPLLMNVNTMSLEDGRSNMLGASHSPENKVPDPVDLLETNHKRDLPRIHATPPSTSETGQNKAIAQEKATSLRNDKLLAAADGSDDRPDLAASRSGAIAPNDDHASSPRSALTHANVELLDRDIRSSERQARSRHQRHEGNDEGQNDTDDGVSASSNVAQGGDSSNQGEDSQQGANKPLSRGDHSNDGRAKKDKGKEEQEQNRMALSPRKGHSRKWGSNATSRSRNEGLERNDSEKTVTKEDYRREEADAW